MNSRTAPLHYGFFFSERMLAPAMQLSHRNIVLGISGSIAAYKTPYIVRALVAKGADVHVVMTPSARNFVSPLVLSNLSHHDVAIDMFDENVQHGGSWHIHMARECAAMLVAPASAKTIAALAYGLSDTTLGCVALALPTTTPLVIAPAMDTDMWMNSVTQHNVELLRSRGAIIIPPEHGELASGFAGVGRLPEPETIVAALEIVLARLNTSGTPTKVGSESTMHEDVQRAAQRSTTPLQEAIDSDAWNAQMMFHELKSASASADDTSRNTLHELRNKVVLITAGPTRERIDDVRYLSNYSSGKMGYALASQARDAGARVVLVSGPVNLPVLDGVETIHVESAREMFDIVQQYATQFDIAVFAAAVADFRAASPVTGKIKKADTNDPLSLSLEQNPDILKSISQSKTPTQTVVGFALESQNELQYGIDKLKRKACDMIVLNSSRPEHSAIGSDSNTVTIIRKTSNGIDHEQLPSMSKSECARAILQSVLLYRAKKE